jgi:hypothetical protein
MCVRSDARLEVDAGSCDELSHLTVSDLTIVDTGGDGVVSPGEVARLGATLNEVGGHNFNRYPGVTFTADRADVTIGNTDWRFALSACHSARFQASATFGPSIPVGTTVRITARVAMLNRDCPGAHAIALDVTVH